MNAASNNAEAAAVLDFWFGAGDAPRAEWFRKDPAFDALIAERFGPLVEQALAGELHDWARQSDTALARILLLDQFTRNIFRDSARAFAGDALALAAARAMVAAGQDLQLPPLGRAFVYLPFEHAEELAAQDEAVRLFTALAAHSPLVQEMLDYAHRHRAVIERFGRFPHRNDLLERESTADEIAFLREPGSRF
ncbi:hypothetical protein BURC_00511 [Burkholderiaceae bacterium]|nr:hypothetical protein BURC_00511 [Burkholderiaceae bacterium]